MDSIEIKDLDLAFSVDCTGSMSSYIAEAKKCIHDILHSIRKSLRCKIRCALVEYRDHPPEERTFVTRVHDFTTSETQMSTWINAMAANGGGDAPEAVADALHELSSLSWSNDATKVAVLVADAPPHGIGCHDDRMRDGCPDHYDPIQKSKDLARRTVTLYVLGCEPSLLKYKDFFHGLAFNTGGQYIPLKNSIQLSQTIVSAVRVTTSAKPVVDEITSVIAQVKAEFRTLDESELTKIVHDRLSRKGIKVNELVYSGSGIEPVSSSGRHIANSSSVAAVRRQWESASPSASFERAADDLTVSVVSAPVSVDRVEREVRKLALGHPDIVKLS